MMLRDPGAPQGPNAPPGAGDPHIGLSARGRLGTQKEGPASDTAPARTLQDQVPTRKRKHTPAALGVRRPHLGDNTAPPLGGPAQ